MTIWSDQKNELTVLKSLYKKTTDDYYSSKKEAKEAIDKKLRTKIPLTGTTWFIHKDLPLDQEISDNDSDTFTMSFISDTQVQVMNKVVNRSEMPTDYPACMQDNNCTVGNLSDPIEYCESNDVIDNPAERLSWNNCPIDKKGIATWFYKEDKMTAEYSLQDPLTYNYKDVWVKQ